MQATLSAPLMKLLKKWYQNPPSEYTDGSMFDDVDIRPYSYLRGVEDGKKELATDILEYLDFINHN